jgi:PEP-CTERM/exosortase A-associated glycosyltransferase
MDSGRPGRILHVLDHSLPITSGYSYRSRSIVTWQKRLGLDPAVLTSPKHGSDRNHCEMLDGIAHYRTGRAGGRLPVVSELRLMARLARRIMRVAREVRAEVIHAHSPVLNGLPALWAGRRLGLPTVYEVRTFWEDAAVSHGTHGEGSVRYRLSRAMETSVLRRVDTVVAIGRGIQGEVRARGVAPDRIVIVPNGVDAEWLEPRPRIEDLAHRLGIGAGPVFGYVGSFSHYEGLPFLIAAMSDLAARIPGVRLVIAGSGRDEHAVREAAWKAGPAVTLLGRIPQEQVRDLYTLLDVLVLPRQRIRLTELVTPLKPLEAMAAGTAVLASDIGGHAEMIVDGDTGLLFKAESRDSLVEQATRLAGDAPLRRHLRENARRFIESERTWDRVVARYLPIYAGAARRAGGTG